MHSCGSFWSQIQRPWPSFSLTLPETAWTPKDRRYYHLKSSRKRWSQKIEERLKKISLARKSPKKIPETPKKESEGGQAGAQTCACAGAFGWSAEKLPAAQVSWDGSSRKRGRSKMRGFELVRRCFGLFAFAFCFLLVVFPKEKWWGAQLCGENEPLIDMIKPVASVWLENSQKTMVAMGGSGIDSLYPQKQVASMGFMELADVCGWVCQTWGNQKVKREKDVSFFCLLIS